MDDGSSSRRSKKGQKGANIVERYVLSHLMNPSASLTIFVTLFNVCVPALPFPPSLSPVPEQSWF